VWYILQNTPYNSTLVLLFSLFLHRGMLLASRTTIESQSTGRGSSCRTLRKESGLLALSEEPIVLLGMDENSGCRYWMCLRIIFSRTRYEKFIHKNAHKFDFWHCYIHFQQIGQLISCIIPYKLISIITNSILQNFLLLHPDTYLFILCFMLHFFFLLYYSKPLDWSRAYL